MRLPAPNRRPVLWLLGLWLAATLSAGHALAQSSGSSPGWRELTPLERHALSPLQGQWAQIDAVRKQKWREIAAKYPSMERTQQIRLQARMAEWAAMPTAQRNAARLYFENTRQMAGDQRQALWEAYQGLPEEQRKALVAQAGQRKVAAEAAAKAASANLARTAPIDRTQPKSNVVPPRAQATGKAVAVGTVQASVGATTRPINERPTPPRHQQVGMPKIAATPGFVNGSTLLPQRGPQGAGAEPVTAAQ